MSERSRLLAAKLLYGTGAPGVRGVCVYDAWRNGRTNDVIEICAFGEESQIQLAGTSFHEFGHCLARWEAGHGIVWKRQAHQLGLRRALAAGQHYRTEDFDPNVLIAIEALGPISDGHPAASDGTSRQLIPAHCPLGVGTRGGTSRGTNSGSRLRLFECACVPPVKARVARDDFHAQCTDCGCAFKRRITPAERKI